MVTIQLASEDISAQKLKSYLDEQGVTKDLDVSIVKAKKEGLSSLQDAVQFVIDHQNEIKVGLLVVALDRSLSFLIKEAYNSVAPDPRILVYYSNNQEKVISCKGKSGSTIAKELMAEIKKGEVIRVIFKS